MTYSKVSNYLLVGVNADTKPTTFPNGTVFIETDTGNISQYVSGAWTVIAGTQRTETLQNKTISASSNTFTDTSAAVGDILAISSGTSFKRKAMGTANQVLCVNGSATGITYASFNAENTGTATGSATGSTATFTIAHSLGTTPYCAFVQVSSVLGSNLAYSYSYDSTNITVLFASNPTSGTITFQWRVVA